MNRIVIVAVFLIVVHVLMGDASAQVLGKNRGEIERLFGSVHRVGKNVSSSDYLYKGVIVSFHFDEAEGRCIRVGYICDAKDYGGISSLLDPLIGAKDQQWTKYRDEKREYESDSYYLSPDKKLIKYVGSIDVTRKGSKTKDINTAFGIYTPKMNLDTFKHGVK